MKRLAVVGLLILGGLAQSAHAADVPITGTLQREHTWTNTNRYILQGIVYVGNGTAGGQGTVSIEKGTVVRGRPGSALVITRLSQIFAWGTVHQPIIFTAHALAGDAEPCARDADRGLWGGLIVLGNAAVQAPSGQAAIEVLPPTGARTQYGGGATPVNEETSGVLRHVSIRHSGQALGGEGDVNGLTLGGVGHGTIIEYVEVYCGADDGFEWFGGQVSAKYLVSALNGDDAFDLDQGYRGSLQFLLSLNSRVVGDSCLEVGSEGEENAVALQVANATCIGTGTPAPADNTPAVNVRGASRLLVSNSILQAYPQECLDIEAGSTGVVRTNAWFDFAAFAPPPATTRPFPACVTQNGTLAQTANRNLNPRLRGLSRTPDGGLDPRLRGTSPAFIRTEARALPADGFFETTQYIGAFDATELWVCSWTALAAVGYLPEEACP